MMASGLRSMLLCWILSLLFNHIALQPTVFAGTMSFVNESPTTIVSSDCNPNLSIPILYISGFGFLIPSKPESTITLKRSSIN